jgi:hypothetical protein
MKNKPLSSSKFNFLKTAFIVLTVFGVLYACSKSTDTTSSVDCSGTTKSFSTDVNPIIQANCATNSGCHGSGSNNGPGELLTYSEIFNARSSIRPAVLSGSMPKTGSLTTAQKNAIICWIDNGAANN